MRHILLGFSRQTQYEKKTLEEGYEGLRKQGLDAGEVTLFSPESKHIRCSPDANLY